MSIKLTASIWQEDDRFVSLCPELGVSSFGRDSDHALEMLRDAVELYLANAKELDMLEN